MVNRDLLQENFDSIGVDVSPDILDVCQEICILHHVEEEEFVNMWIAYSISKLKNHPPTSKYLYQMAQEQLENKVKKTKSKTSENTTPSLKIYNAGSSKFNSYITTDEDIIDSYSSSFSEKKNGPQIILKTPERSRKNTADFSPASFSAKTGTPSTRYETRTNAGSVVVSFGSLENSHSSSNNKTVPIKVASLIERPPINFPSFGNTGEFLQENLQSLEKILITNIPDEIITNNYSIITGRITSATSERMRLDKVNLDMEDDKGNYVLEPLVFGDIDELAMFPGQIAAILSNYGKTKDSQIVAENIFTEALPPLRTFSNESPLQILIASGPFTQSDTLNYQPLADLATYAAEHKPDVVILVGPFVDASHPLIEDCTLAETFQSFFEKLLVLFMEPLKGLSTQVILVSSQRDVNCPCVYPTPPYQVKNLKNVHFFSDPAKITLGNIIVAVTSTDVLKHLSKFEFYKSSQPSKDRIGRLAKHLLCQQSIYPLYPPDPEVSLDLGLYSKYCHFELMPHLLIVPSDLKYFIKDINGCLVVNPARLAKGLIGGTFTKIQINKKPQDNSQVPFTNYVHAEIIHI